MPIRFLILLCALMSCPAFAALGDTLSATSPEITKQVSPVPYVQGLAVYTSTSRSGVRISEYMNFQGTIVAVAWQGPLIPNMRELLGAHFQTYLHGSTETGTSRRRGDLNTPDLVVQLSGHLRAFQGKAYLPKMLTSDNVVEQIR